MGQRFLPCAQNDGPFWLECQSATEDREDLLMEEVKSPTLGRSPEEAKTLGVLHGWQWQGAGTACVGRVFSDLLVLNGPLRVI